MEPEITWCSPIIRIFSNNSVFNTTRVDIVYVFEQDNIWLFHVQNHSYILNVGTADCCCAGFFFGANNSFFEEEVVAVLFIHIEKILDFHEIIEGNDDCHVQHTAGIVLGVFFEMILIQP